MTAPASISRRALMLAPLVLLTATPALARSEKKEGQGDAKVDPVIRLQALALPIIRDGQLVNYVFVQLSLTLKTGVVTTVLEGKEPLLRDALVRAAHRTPFTRIDSNVAVDEPRLRAAVLREASLLIGPGKVLSAAVVKQTPRFFVPAPSKAPAGPAPVRAAPAAPDIIP